VFENLNRLSIWSIIASLILFVVFSVSELKINNFNSFQIKIVKAASADSYGAVTFVSSLPSSSNKTLVASKIASAGMGWAREEYTYPVVDYAPYDSAYSKLKGQGFQILGLLTYPGGISHDEWKSYVNKVVGHFPGVSAWEVMNEADNYLSPADYAVFLREAHQIIKAKGNATVVCSGLTARKEVYPFWTGLRDAGGWDSFDVIGLHMFHDGSPFEDSYNNGTFSQEIQKVINTVGDKPIWITELGYDSNNYGSANQASWLVESLKIARNYPQVYKVFIFRAYDHGNGLGLLSSSFAEKESYVAVKNWLLNGDAPEEVATPEPTVVSNEPEPSQDSEPIVYTPKPALDPEKSSLRLDEKTIVDGKERYRIVVTMIDVDGNLILDRKPVITLTGGQTDLTDFVLVGNEWFAYITSNELGERKAEISLGKVTLGEVKMDFLVQPTKSPIINTPELIDPSQPNKNLIFYLIGTTGLIVLTGLLIYLRLRLIKLQSK